MPLQQVYDKVNQSQKLKKLSNNIKFGGKLISFLYILMRDYFIPGQLQKIIEKIKLENGQSNILMDGLLNIQIIWQKYYKEENNVSVLS